MVQTRVCSYFQFHCNHINATTKTFESLPEDLRDRVYRDAGVAAGTTLRVVGPGLSNELAIWSDDSFNLAKMESEPYFCLVQPDDGILMEEYYSLRISSRFLSSDVARFVFSHNEILVCCEDYTNISILLEAPSFLYKAIRRLTVHFDFHPSHTEFYRYNFNCCHTDPDCQRRCSKRGLNSALKDFAAMIIIWCKVVDRLALKGDLSTLRLDILCDVEDISAARLLMEPLERMKVVSGVIQIRASGSVPRFALQDVARQAVCGMGRLPQPFRFLDLPTELRQHIMSYTDLVAPLRTVRCPDGLRFECVRDWQDRSICSSREFCSIYGAAYPSCNCWMPPTAMFLVCKVMLQDARAIFFASNRFSVVLRGMLSGSQRTVDEPFEASVFLRKTLPLDAIRYLRKLDLRFPPLFHNHPGLHKDVYDHWLQTVDYIAPHLKTLTLQVQFCDEIVHVDPRFPNSRLPDPDFCNMWQSHLFRMHEQIVQPLSKLKSIRSFWPRVIADFNWQSIDKQEVRAHETRLQLLVLRPDPHNCKGSAIINE